MPITLLLDYTKCNLKEEVQTKLEQAYYTMHIVIKLGLYWGMYNKM